MKVHGAGGTLYVKIGVKDRWSEDWWRMAKGAMAHFGGGHLKMKGDSSDGTFPFRPRVTAVWANDACRFIKRAAPSSAKDDKHEAKVK